jgi:hypothetical protein
MTREDLRGSPKAVLRMGNDRLYHIVRSGHATIDQLKADLTKHAVTLNVERPDQYLEQVVDKGVNTVTELLTHGGYISGSGAIHLGFQHFGIRPLLLDAIKRESIVTTSLQAIEREGVPLPATFSEKVRKGTREFVTMIAPYTLPDGSLLSPAKRLLSRPSWLYLQTGPTQFRHLPSLLNAITKYFTTLQKESGYPQIPIANNTLTHATIREMTRTTLRPPVESFRPSEGPSIFRDLNELLDPKTKGLTQYTEYPSWMVEPAPADPQPQGQRAVIYEYGAPGYSQDGFESRG